MAGLIYFGQVRPSASAWPPTFQDDFFLVASSLYGGTWRKRHELGCKAEQAGGAAGARSARKRVEGPLPGRHLCKPPSLHRAGSVSAPSSHFSAQ